MRTALLSFFILCATFTQAQTYFYINTITVEPTSPTTDDAITISLSGDLSSSGAYIVSTSHMLMGNIVHISVTAADPGGLSVLAPHTEVVEIGPIPAGSYGILVDGSFILDSAPEFQHSFVVTGSGQANCDELDIVSLTWSAFTDTSLILHVNNNGASNFNYPTFLLLDENGDTLAIETDIQFALVGESWHVLDILGDTEIPEGALPGTLELYTDFLENFACAWDQTIDLCPATECTAVFPTLGNFGDGLAIGTYTWTISDDGGIITQGQFELTAELQSDQDEACLPPGAYQMVVAFDQEPTGGQLIYGISAEYFDQGPTEHLFFGALTPMPFDLLERCTDGTNIVEEMESTSHLMVRTMGRSILVSDRTGAPLGTVILYNAVGKEISRARTSSDQVHFDVATDGMYILHTTKAVAKVLVEQR